MALKRKLTKEAFEKLADSLKSEYKEVSGEFLLDIEGDEDTGALKRAKDRESQRARDAEERAKTAETKLSDIEGNNARKNGDIETLQKSWDTKYAALETSHAESIGKKNEYIKEKLIDSVALKMASEISTAPKVILPHIKSRLTADLDGDTPSTKILDASGQPSALSLEELEKEIVGNKDFASIIIASKASGSGATNDGKQNTTGSASGVDSKKVMLSDMDPKALAATLKPAE